MGRAVAAVRVGQHPVRVGGVVVPEVAAPERQQGAGAAASAAATELVGEGQLAGELVLGVVRCDDGG